MTAGRAWQTWAVLASVAATARWAAGPTFGYTLFAAVWGPVAAVGVASDGSRATWRRAGGVVVLTALPWWLAESASTAGRLTVLLSAWTACLTAVFLSSIRLGAPATIARALAVIGWLTWIALPLTRADAWNGVLGEGRFGRLLTAQPVVAANAVSDTAADWSHQAVAYRWLTVLGQDVVYSPPDTIWPSVGGHAGVGLLWGTVMTIGLMRRQLFHVEQLPL